MLNLIRIERNVGGEVPWNIFFIFNFLQFVKNQTLAAKWWKLNQRTLTLGGNITVRLVSTLTGTDQNDNMLLIVWSEAIESTLAKLETSRSFLCNLQRKQSSWSDIVSIVYLNQRKLTYLVRCTADLLFGKFGFSSFVMLELTSNLLVPLNRNCSMGVQLYSDTFPYKVSEYSLS